MGKWKPLYALTQEPYWLLLKSWPSVCVKLSKAPRKLATEIKLESYKNVDGEIVLVTFKPCFLPTLRGRGLVVLPDPLKVGYVL